LYFYDNPNINRVTQHDTNDSINHTYTKKSAFSEKTVNKNNTFVRLFGYKIVNKDGSALNNKYHFTILTSENISVFKNTFGSKNVNPLNVIDTRKYSLQLFLKTWYDQPAPNSYVNKAVYLASIPFPHHLNRLDIDTYSYIKLMKQDAEF